MTDSDANGSPKLGAIGPELFRFRGRMGRKVFWLGFLGLIVLAFLLLGAFAPMMRTTGMDGGERVFLLVMQIITFVYLAWLMIRRLHDINLSGWWFLLLGPLPILAATNINSVYQYIPQTYEAQQAALPWISVVEFGSYALLLGGLIVLGFIRGTAGPNKYGPSPIAARNPGA